MKKDSIKQKIVVRVIMIGVVMFALSILLVYCLFVPNMKKSAIMNAEQKNKEIARQIDTLNSFIEDYTENLVLAVENSMGIMDYFDSPDEQKMRMASLNLNNLISNEGIARAVFIVSENGFQLDSLNRITDKDKELLRSEWFLNLHGLKYARGFSKVYQIEINKTKYYTAAYLKNFHFHNKLYSYIVFYDLNNLIYDISVSAGSGLDYYELVDSENQVFYSAGNRAEDSGADFTKLTVDSKWRVNSFVSNRSIYKTFENYIFFILLIFSLFLIFSSIFLTNALKDVINPIEKLSREMEKVADGNLNCILGTERNDEIGRLYASFNRMTVDLKHSLSIISEKEKMESQAKFSLLVSQIDPHFIYNTINSINYLARKKRCGDIITVNSALIFILQDRLRVNDIQISDSVGHEMEVVNQYIVIQKYMYEGSLDFQWDVPDELLEEQIPKNMIQPIVENSLFHGLIDEESGDITGTIKVSIRKADKTLTVRVEDNGKGMDSERLEQVRNETFEPKDRGKKVGLSNIRGRLYYLYGDYECLTIESTPEKGTCVTLELNQPADSNKFQQNMKKL